MFFDEKSNRMFDTDKVMTAAQRDSLVSKIVEKNVQLLMSEFSIDVESAFDFVYKSNIFDSLNVAESGLRARSADYVYELLRAEYLAGKTELFSQK